MDVLHASHRQPGTTGLEGMHQRALETGPCGGDTRWRDRARGLLVESRPIELVLVGRKIGRAEIHLLDQRPADEVDDELAAREHVAHGVLDAR